MTLDTLVETAKRYEMACGLTKDIMLGRITYYPDNRALSIYWSRYWAIEAKRSADILRNCLPRYR